MTHYEAVREEFDFPFELYPFQVECVDDLSRYPQVGFYAEPGCVDSDTEYLTRTGWVKISEYASGEVAQFNPATGFAEFVTPNKYVKEPCAEMIRIKTKYGLDQLLSDGHKVLTYRGNEPGQPPQTVSAVALLEAHDRKHRKEPTVKGGISFNHTAIGAVFKVAGGPGMNLTDEQLRLQVAVIADGHFQRDTDTCVVRVKKNRKVQRLRYLLEEAGVNYTEQARDYPSAVGFHVFSFRAPLRVKEFDERFWDADLNQINLLAHEAVLWDGTWRAGNRGVSFSSTSAKSADFVQYIWTVTGRITRIAEDKREDKYTGGVCYEVLRRGHSKALSGMLHLYNRSAPTMWREPSTDGFKYCFNVPTGFLVLRRNGRIFTTGNTGKTAMSTHWALHHMMHSGIKHWVIVMPPILVLQWARFLRSVKDKRTGKALTVTTYSGGPAARAKLDLGAQFVLMSYGLMRNDQQRLTDFYANRSMGIMCDEAHAIKNAQSQTHKVLKDLATDRHLALLTGTPLTTPIDAYAYLRLITGNLIYRNFHQFERVHIKEKDEYGKIVAWDNLGLLADNMKLQTSRVLRREVQSELPAITYTLIPYDLAPAHQKLYERIAVEKLVEFDDGREINAISTQALYSALQQVIINWSHFEDDPSKEPAALELVDEIFDEIGPTAKLAVVANFIRSNSYLLEKLQKYGAVAVYGEVSAKGKQEAINKFIEDPTCRCILLQPRSAGFGVDGLQHVCSDMLFLEAPTVAPPFYQTAARLDRDGQKSPVNCRIGVANRTVQVRMFKGLLENDKTTNAVQGGYKDLKDAINGN